MLSGNFDVCFKPVKEEFHPDYAGVATRYYEKPMRVLVMFWLDKSNILPTEPNCLFCDFECFHTLNLLQNQ